MPRQYTFTEFIEQFWARVDRSGDCWVWSGSPGRSGYGHIHSRPFGDWETHKLAYTLAHGQIPGGMLVCHSCDNRLCCNPAHLFLGTHAVNTRDMIAKGRQGAYLLPGSLHPNARLTEEAVRDIRARNAAGVPQAALAREFGVSQSVISDAVSGKSWKHVAAPLR